MGVRWALNDVSNNILSNPEILLDLPKFTFICHALFSVCLHNVLFSKKQLKGYSLVSNHGCFLLKKQKYIYYFKWIPHYINNNFLYMRTIFALTSLLKSVEQVVLCIMKIQEGPLYFFHGFYRNSANIFICSKQAILFPNREKSHSTWTSVNLKVTIHKLLDFAFFPSVENRVILFSIL